MVKKSDSRIARDAQKARAEQAQKDAARRKAEALKNDPMGQMAQEELAKISEQEEADALNGIGRDVWGDLELIYNSSRIGVTAIGREIANLNDKQTHAFIKDQAGFTDRVRIFHADTTRVMQELEAIHALHSHRGDDKQGPRERFAAMEIAELYSAWSTKSMSILNNTMVELTAMYDEGNRARFAATQAVLAEMKAEEELADPNVVSDVTFTEAPAARGQTSSIVQIDEVAHFGTPAADTAETTTQE